MDLDFKDPDTRQELHHHFAATCFNQTWGFIDQATRTPEETEDMLAACYASLYHWKQRADCAPRNLSVAFWQLSRVHALAGHAALATSWGERCLAVSTDAELPAFYLGYAHEALARAGLERSDTDAASAHLEAATEALTKVTDAESREMLKADLEALGGQLGG